MPVTLPPPNPEYQEGNPLYASRYEALTQHIQEKPLQRLYLVVDPLLRPLRADEPMGELLSGIEPATVALPGDVVEAHRCAQIYALDLTQEQHFAVLQRSLYEALMELQPDMLAYGSGRRICGWIASATSPYAIAEHLAMNELQQSPFQGRVWLRLHDPAVLWSLLQMLYEQQVAQLLAPIDAFWFLSPRGHISRGAGDKRIPAGQGKMVPGHDEWIDIHHIEAINQFLLQLPETMSPEQLGKHWEVTVSALRVAATHGISDTKDLVFFANQALKHGGNFHLNPNVQNKLKTRKPGETWRQLWRNV